MKKVLSLVLALAMVLGMGTMAFAAKPVERTGWTSNINDVIPSGYTVTDVSGWPTQATLDAVPSGNSVFTVNVPATQLKLTTNRNLELTITNAVEVAVGVLAKAGAIAIGDFTMTNGAGASGAWDADVAPAPADLTALQTAAAAISGLDTAVAGDTFNLSYAATRTNRDAITITFTRGSTTDPSSSTPPSTSTSIPSSVEISAIADGWDSYIPTGWSDGDFDPTSNDEVAPDQTAKIALRPGMFVWQTTKAVTIDGVAYAKGATWTPSATVAADKNAMRSSHVKNVDVRKTNPKNNSGTISSVTLDGLVVKIELVEYFLKCGDTDVSFDLTLTHKSKASDSKVAIDFTIANTEEEIEDGQDYVYTDGHVYVKAIEGSVRNIEMILSDNLSLYKSFGKGQKAYANVSLELSAGDEKLFMQFPELSDVYTLYTVGVNSANVYAQFNELGDTFFVYDENYKLIGTTSDSKLPFSNKYYLTTAKVDLTGGEELDDESPAESIPDDTDNVDSGGGSTAVSNYNPNTGR